MPKAESREQASAPSPDAPDARERILKAATELIASDGIDEVRIARVANRARASTALVHHYFSTREELLAQALLQSFELAADERFGAGPAAAGSATEGLAIAIDECLSRSATGLRVSRIPTIRLPSLSVARKRRGPPRAPTPEVMVYMSTAGSRGDGFPN